MKEFFEIPEMEMIKIENNNEMIGASCGTDSAHWTCGDEDDCEAER